MSHQQPAPGRSRGDLIALVVSVAVGATLAAVGVISVASAASSDPGQQRPALVNYDQ
jgi:hypothetical protein